MTLSVTLRITAGLAIALGASWAVGLRLNLTGSIPVGLYRRQAVHPGAIGRGAVVLACLPRDLAVFARARGYVPRGGCPGGAMPVGKVVLATAGDTVVVTDSGLRVNGARIPDTRPLGTDRRGRALPGLARGRYVVAPGMLWLRSCSPFGFDSRYFGAVPVGAVRATLRRLWTW